MASSRTNLSLSGGARTKIVATMGPACENPDIIRQLIQSGVDIFRLNFAHGNYEWLAGIVSRIREISDEIGRAVGLLGDLSGPKIRLGSLPGGEVNCSEGARFRFIRGHESPTPGELTCSYESLIDDVEEGDRILLADGTVAMLVTAKEEDGSAVECVVVQSGIIRSRQGVNLPGVRLSTPSITEKDQADLKWALETGLDFIGLSFVRTADDIDMLRRLIDEQAPESSPLIVAKIEKTEAIDDLDNILESTDAVMVARGDLGVEAEISRVPVLQKRIIARCNEQRIPVITATQMLDSMQQNDLPTRAEASDVANAVLDGTDAVMLSGETAIGLHPVTCVRMMERIASEAEALLRPKLAGEPLGSEGRLARPITEAVTRGAILAAEELEADLLVVATVTGRTALALSNYRSTVPILALTQHDHVARRMCLYFGVTSLRSRLISQSADALLQFVVHWGMENDILQSGSKLVVVGHTNWLGDAHDLMTIHEVP